MERKEILELLESKTYEFLRTNEHLKDRILFLCLGGSHSYGTNIETSDVDIRGVALETEDDILGITHFEQFQNTQTDTTIYAFSKFVDLAKDDNPNIIEMLFCRPDHYFYVSPLGQYILDHRHLFLSQKAKHTFGGYAHAQLNRLENAFVRNGEVLSLQEEKEHINRSVENCLDAFIERYGIEPDAIKTYVSEDKDGIPQIYVDFNFKRYLLGDTREMISQMTDVLRQYMKTDGNRNHKKDDLHLNKHMMHLIRLYQMACEIFETGDLHTYREKDHDLLMDIRGGKYRIMAEDGVTQLGATEEFYELLHSLENRLEEAVKTTKIPHKVQHEKINELKRYVIMKGIFKNEDSQC